jgi:uncharacterized protein (TIGR04552 family)
VKANPFEPLLPDLPVRTVQEMGLKELERIRLILRGGSIIEWRRLHFRTRDEVDRFLRLCLINPDDPNDEAWARVILNDAVDYLRRTFDYRVSDAVAIPAEIHDLFLYASGVKEPARYRRIACVVLKVMHVIQHLEGRDILYRLAMSEAELQRLITEKVLAVAEEMRSKGLPIVEFSHSHKTHQSIITKLLAKKETIAAQLYDKTRFRIVTRTRDDVLVVLYFLTQRLFPFNFVVPGQAENSLIDFKSLLSQYPHLAHHSEQLHLDLDYETRQRRERNRFSGSSYRMLSFVADIPIRLDALLPPPERDNRARKSRIGFALAEFQIVDQQTAIQNEEGENSHQSYKARQRAQVLRRLSRGLVVPRRQPRWKVGQRPED